MTRIYIIAALALALAASIWWQDRTQKKLNATRVELSQKKAEIEVERAARAHEIKIAKEASDAFTSKVAALEADLANRPLKPVVIRVRDKPSVSAGAESGTASGPSTETEGREHGETEADITTELTDYSLDCQRNTSQLESLQSWVLAR